MITEEIDHVWLHLDEFDELDTDTVQDQFLHIYSFVHEDRDDELRRTLDGLREQFIFGTGIIWPSSLEGEVESLDVRVLNALEWITVIDGDVDVGTIDRLQRQL